VTLSDNISSGYRSLCRPDVQLSTVTRTTGTFSVAHGGPRKPDFVRMVARCVISKAGYSVGDEIDLLSGSNNNGHVTV
jgi:hypothetical protein